jgi:hypothetical protein
MAKNRMEELLSRPLQSAEDAMKNEPASDGVPWEEPSAEPAAPEKSEPPPRQERSLLPTYRKPHEPVATTPVDTPPPPEIIKPSDPPEPCSTMSSNNQQKLRQAILHLTRYFHLADAEQIEERKFFGDLTIVVKWRNGQAELISAGMDGTDRGVRHGR